MSAKPLDLRAIQELAIGFGGSRPLVARPVANRHRFDVVSVDDGDGGGDYRLARCRSGLAAEFIVMAGETVPLMVDEIRRLRADLKAAQFNAEQAVETRINVMKTENSRLREEVAGVRAENARLLKALAEAKTDASDWALEACIVGGHDVPSELGDWTSCWSDDFGKGFNGWQLTMGEYVATVQDPKDAQDSESMAEWKIWRVTLEGPVELEGQIDWGDRGMVVRAMRDAKAALDKLTATEVPHGR
jgi:hypothetical protein